MSYRDEIKRPARRALHEKSKVPALYLASPAGTPVPVGVRVHTKFAPQGSLTGAGAGWADRQDTQPKLIFQRSEMQPAQGAFVSVALGEAYTQFHTFAGIGVWSYALRMAGWEDDRPVWTGSCPCQPFSSAGKGAGFDDERHLWPFWHHLIRVCRPSVVFGEQVASKDGLEWFDLVQSDLEGEGYAVGAQDRCSAGVGAPHIRQRLYFVATETLGLANAEGFGGRPGLRGDGPAQFGRHLAGNGSGAFIMGDAAGSRGYRRECREVSGATGCHEGATSNERHGHPATCSGSVSLLGDTSPPRLPLRQCPALVGDGRREEGRAAQQSGGSSSRLALAGSIGRERREGASEGSLHHREDAGRVESQHGIVGSDQVGVCRLAHDHDAERRSDGPGGDFCDGPEAGRHEGPGYAGAGGGHGDLAYDPSGGRREERPDARGRPGGDRAQGDAAGSCGSSSSGGLADAYGGKPWQAGCLQPGREHGLVTQDRGIVYGDQRPGPVNGPWRDADWLFCRDGKWRPVESSAQQMADGSASSMGRLCADQIADVEKAVEQWSQRSGYAASEGVRDLWDLLSEEEVEQRTDGRFGSVQEAPFLLAFLRQLSDQGWRFALGPERTSSEASRRALRVLRYDEFPSYSSCGRGLGEQFSGEPADPLRLLSQILAYHTEICWGHTRWKDVSPFPLATNAKERVGRLRAYGNAIDAENARDFISTFREAEAAGFDLDLVGDLDEDEVII